MSLENAKANLKRLGEELKFEEELKFDENNSCILAIDNAFSVHITYEPKTDRLYLYSPLLDGLPKDDKTLLQLYQMLLEGSLLGGYMAGGGVGVAVKEELILMHCVLDMGLGVEVNALANFAALFVETVEMWRERVKKRIAGEDPGPCQLPAAAQKGQIAPPSGAIPEKYKKV